MFQGKRRCLLTANREILLLQDSAGNLQLFVRSEQAGVYHKCELHDVTKGILIQIKESESINVTFAYDN